MTPRSLPLVLDQILAHVPGDPANAPIRSFLRSCRERVTYTAPEAMHQLWAHVSETLAFYFPADETKLLPWQREVVGIWTGDQS